MDKQRIVEIQERLRIPKRDLSESELSHYGEVGIRKGYQFYEVCEAVWEKVQDGSDR